MTCEFVWQGVVHKADLSDPVDLSIPLAADGQPNPSAWYVPPPSMTPVRGDGFVGAVVEGGSVNFRNISFNPHGHGTHTECMGHITPVVHPVDPLFRNRPAFFPCAVLTVQPQQLGGDWVVKPDALDAMAELQWPPALVIRTLPNDPSKTTQNWSNTNPPYLSAEVTQQLATHGVQHLLIDLPSVDREVDGGRLEAHHAFWGLPNNLRPSSTITEMVYTPQNVSDGMWLLHLGVAPFMNDASPSRPVLYPVIA